MRNKLRIAAFLLSVLLTVGAIPAFVVSDAATLPNVALGKTVSGPGSWLSDAVDGDVSTYWDGGSCPAALTVDLEDTYTVEKITLVTYYDGSRYYTYRIYTSLDGVDYTLYAEKTNSAVSTSAGDSYTGTVQARYVKAEILSNSANPAAHISEIFVYGGKEGGQSTDPNDPDNLAYGKPTRSNSTTGDHSAVVDGRDNTYWTGKEFPMYVDVDLLDNYGLTSVKVSMPSGSWAYDIYGSTDGVNFTKLAQHPYAPVTSGGDVFALDAVCRILRVNVTLSSSGLGGSSRISEIRAYGTPVDLVVTPTRETMTFDSYENWLENNYGVSLSEGYTVEDTYDEDDTFEALYGIIERLLGASYKSWFAFEIEPSVDGCDYYDVSTVNGKTKIVGNNGSSIAVGINAYLKEYCNVHISQQTANAAMPAQMPVVTSPLTGSSPYAVRYAYNYCTLSYTMPFYGYDDWQRELDYLALSGVNVILDTTATEALWVAYLQKFGYSADDAKNFVCGYAYKAWWLMGNLENYGGSVSDQWILDTLNMARVNQRFMTVLGIKPCLQGFMGTLPTTFAELAGETLTGKGYEDISSYMVAQGSWSGFTRPPLLKTTYDGYEELADTFYDTQKELYGDITDYYAGDLAHEGGVIPQDLSRSLMAGQILDHMLDNDADAVWIIQCWWGNPEKAVLDGFGAENRANHLLVLDLNATVSSNYANTSSWGGREWNGSGWVFCMLDNYGGRPGVHGELEYMMNSIIEALGSCSHMKGIGLVSEGTQMNPVVQELLWEMAWHTESFDMNEWLHAYASRRYGAESDKINRAWDILLDTAYGYAGPHNFNINSIVNMLPSFSPSAISGSATMTYDAHLFEEAVALFMEEFDTFADKETYIYDAVDLIRQLLSNSMTNYFNVFVAANNDGDFEARREMAEKFLSCVELMDEVCSFEIDSTAGEWIGRVDRFVSDSRTGSYDDYSVDTMKYNAKAIITAWCSKILHTYAYRQYSGQLTDYNYVMWSRFFDAVEDGGTLPTNRDFFLDAWNFVLSDKSYPAAVTPARGNASARGLDEVYAEIAANDLWDDAAQLESITGNVATHGVAYAKNAQSTYPASRLNDGDLTGLWVGTSSAFPTYAGITLDKVYAVNEVVITAETRGTPGADIMQYQIQALQNGSFVTVANAQSYDPATGKYTVTVTFDEPVVTNDVRVNLVSVAQGSQIWPALAEIKIMSYGDTPQPTEPPTETPTEPEKTTYQLSGLRYGSGMENWVNSANNPLGVGQAPGVTEILFGASATSQVPGSTLSAVYANRSAYEWTLYITDEDNNTVEKHIAPASSFNTASSNYFFRFEPCLASDTFVPSPGMCYHIDLRIKGDDVIYYITGDANGYTLSTYPVKADGTYYDASAFVEYPVALTVAPIFDQIENTYGKTWFVVSVNAGKINDLFYGLCRNHTLTLKVTVRDETDGITYVIDSYAFDDPNGYETYGTSFMRFAPCDYGFAPVAGHSYTISLEGYENGELHFAGSSEEGAFERTNAAFATNGPIVPNPVPHSCTVITNVVFGDLDGSGDVDVNDVTRLLDILAGETSDGEEYADLDGDRELSVRDVTALLNYIAIIKFST